MGTVANESFKAGVGEVEGIAMANGTILPLQISARALKLGTRGIPVIDAFTSFYPPHHPMFNRVWNHEINHPFWGVKYPYFWVDTHI